MRSGELEWLAGFIQQQFKKYPFNRMLWIFYKNLLQWKIEVIMRLLSHYRVPVIDFLIPWGVPFLWECNLLHKIISFLLIRQKAYITI